MLSFGQRRIDIESFVESGVPDAVSLALVATLASSTGSTISMLLARRKLLGPNGSYFATIHFAHVAHNLIWYLNRLSTELVP